MMRRAYWCLKCPQNERTRVFLRPNEKIPTCPRNDRHGKLVRQFNKPYRGSRQ